MPQESALRTFREDVLVETLDTVAERAGISKMTLSLIERGHKPRKTNHKILCRGYRVSLKKFRTLIAKA